MPKVQDAEDTPRKTTHLHILSLARSHQIKIFDEDSCVVNKNAYLGQGASMAVYKAQCDIGHGYMQDVAVKFPLAHIAETTESRGIDQALATIFKEIKFMTKFKHHPNIVQFYGIIIDNINIGLVVELAKDTLTDYLRKLLKKGEPADWWIKAKFCYEIAAALKSMNDSGVIFGDLKGDNILVFETPTGVVSKLSDFGFSSTGISVMNGHLPGHTPAFAAPEFYDKNLENNQDGKPGDVYSYGLVVWQIARNGETPFNNLEDVDIQSIKSSDRRLQVLRNKLEEDTPTEFWTVFTDATAYIPDERKPLEEFVDIFKTYVQLDDQYEKIKANFKDASQDSISDNNISLINYLSKLSLNKPMQKRLFDDLQKEDNDVATASQIFCYHYGLGVEKSDTKAVEICTVLAEKGNSNAQYNLGWFLSNGDVEHRYDEAEEWYHKAAEKHHAEAEIHLGSIHYERKEYAEAEEWFLKAAKSDHDYANYNLGLVYDSTKDYSKAIEYYEKAANAGLAEAMLMLGNLYFHGPDPDYTVAIKWFEKAATSGNVEASISLSDVYHTRKDYEQAEKWLLQAVDEKHPRAAYELGLLYSENMIDFDKAEPRFLQAASEGHLAAPYSLGLLYIKMRKFKEAQSWFLKAIGVGIFIPEGDEDELAEIVRSNPQKAAKLLEKEKRPDPLMAFALGVAFELGLECQRDINTAKRFYDMSASGGNDLAKRHVERLCNTNVHDHEKPCGHEFDANEEMYFCLTCGDGNGTLCLTCFYADHKKHEVILGFALNGGGGCDCGDELSWQKCANKIATQTWNEVKLQILRIPELPINLTFYINLTSHYINLTLITTSLCTLEVSEKYTKCNTF